MQTLPMLRSRSLVPMPSQMKKSPESVNMRKGPCSGFVGKFLSTWNRRHLCWGTCWLKSANISSNNLFQFAGIGLCSNENNWETCPARYSNLNTCMSEEVHVWAAEIRWWANQLLDETLSTCLLSHSDPKWLQRTHVLFPLKKRNCHSNNSTFKFNQLTSVADAHCLHCWPKILRYTTPERLLRSKRYQMETQPQAEPHCLLAQG